MHTTYIGKILLFIQSIISLLYCCICLIIAPAPHLNLSALDSMIPWNLFNVQTCLITSAICSILIQLICLSMKCTLIFACLQMLQISHFTSIHLSKFCRIHLSIFILYFYSQYCQYIHLLLEFSSNALLHVILYNSAQLH